MKTTVCNLLPKTNQHAVCPLMSEVKTHFLGLQSSSDPGLTSNHISIIESNVPLKFYIPLYGVSHKLFSYTAKLIPTGVLHAAQTSAPPGPLH